MKAIVDRENYEVYVETPSGIRVFIGGATGNVCSCYDGGNSGKWTSTVLESKDAAFDYLLKHYGIEDEGK